MLQTGALKNIGVEVKPRAGEPQTAVSQPLPNISFQGMSGTMCYRSARPLKKRLLSQPVADSPLMTGSYLIGKAMHGWRYSRIPAAGCGQENRGACSLATIAVKAKRRDSMSRRMVRGS